jgi:hypothetical protein
MRERHGPFQFYNPRIKKKLEVRVFLEHVRLLIWKVDSRVSGVGGGG